MTTKPTAPRHAAVIGGGTMGVGITHVLLDAGVPVTLTETDTARLQAARRAVQASLAASTARGKLSTSPAAAEAQLTTSVRVSDLADAELVVEAVPESITLKHEVLSRAEAVVADTAVLATNTSSLSINQLAKPLRRPARFLGMHFFNPVPASALVEVVRGSATSDAALRTAHAVAALVGKESIEVTDAPGFATSRLGVLLGLEAIRMVEDGVASAADIDKAMVLGYRHPMGPLRLTDLVGLDVRLGIAEYLYGELGDRFAPPRLLREMVAAGRLGKKTGQGFYPWD